MPKTQWTALSKASNQMSETVDHVQLVLQIINLINSRYSHLEGLGLFCDCPAVLQTEKPSPIEGYFPDVFGSTSPQTITLIGEAKTLPDLESPRSFKQITAFLRFLKSRPNPNFIFAIPWRAKITATNIVSRIFEEQKINTVYVEYVTI